MKKTRKIPPASALLPDNAIGFLTEPRYRIYRHLLIIGVLLILSVNTSVLVLQGNPKIPASFIIRESLFTFGTYAGAMYFNIYILVPRLLLENNFWAYFLSVSGVILLILAAGVWMEELLLNSSGLPPGLYSYFYKGRILWFDLVTEFLGMGICIAGTTISVLLRQWILLGERKDELEKTTLRTQAEQIKNRVTPAFLFGMLDRAGTLARSDPDRSSEILLRLSRFLRYRLYDSSRESVLLNSEAAFLENYLKLESVRKDDFRYTVTVCEGCERIPVPPLLFFSLVNLACDCIPAESIRPELQVRFGKAEREVDFFCSGSFVTGNRKWEEGIGEIGKRMELHFGKDYGIKTTENSISLSLPFIKRYE